jgi:uncharacterized Fe-S cluster protein YjdI
MSKELTKKYSNDDITVVWKPKLCIHSTNCWRGLGSVFDPNRKPWVRMEGGTSEQIVAQVEKCPSGALSYYRNEEQQAVSELPAHAVIEVTENGPLAISGSALIMFSDGTEQTCGPKTVLCRCGHSGNKPFCDGSHSRIGFKG